MEYMSLGMLIQYGTPVLLLTLLLMNVWLVVTVRNLVKSLQDAREGMVWNDAYIERNKAVDRRLERLEALLNGGR